MSNLSLWQTSDNFLTILGQQPRFYKLYTQICFCFSCGTCVPDHAIIGTLTEGLRILSKSFPWLAGQIVRDGTTKDSVGIFKIVYLEDAPRLVIKDLRNNSATPSMGDMIHAGFPSSMLDESVFCPVRTFSATERSLGEEAPVLILQLTFLKGGTILACNGQHNVMDMVGQGQVIRLLAKACQKLPFTDEELAWGNCEGGRLIPVLDNWYRPGPELRFQIVQSRPIESDPGVTNETLTPVPGEICRWAYFSVSSSNKVTLKLAASSYPSPTYVSRDDALSALIWRSILRARSLRLNSDTRTTFARAVDVRPFLNISAAYPGLLAIVTYSQLTVGQLIDSPLGYVASILRASVDKEKSNIEHLARAYATVLSRSPDRSILSVSANLDLSVDVMLSSWAKVDCCDLDFGLGLGKPLTVRRPSFTLTESLAYFMPETREGATLVLVCLKEEEMERLAQDREFSLYAKYIG